MYIGYYAGYEVIDGRLHVRIGPDYELHECTLSETVKHYEREKKALTGKIEDLRAENESLKRRLAKIVQVATKPYDGKPTYSNR